MSAIFKTTSFNFLTSLTDFLLYFDFLIGMSMVLRTLLIFCLVIPTGELLIESEVNVFMYNITYFYFKNYLFDLNIIHRLNMSLPLITNSPLAYPVWLKYNIGINPDNTKELYTDYLNEWYKNNKESKSSTKDTIREDYVTLLKDLSFMFNETDKDLFLKELDYNSNEDLIFTIPYFVEKLKEICKSISEKRESLKNQKLKNNLVGSNKGLEKILYEYILKGFTKDEHNISKIPINAISQHIPQLSAISGNFFIEVEELHDAQSYHDFDPSVALNNYFNIEDIVNDVSFEKLKDEEVIKLLSTNYLSRVADTPLSRIFNQYLLSIPTLSTVDLFDDNKTNIYNQIEASKKYLAENVYGLTAVKIKEITTPDYILNLNFENGNNWFYWPSGDKILRTDLYNNVYAPIYINNSNLANSGATGGDDYTNSDLIFTNKNGIVEGAWLEGPRYEVSYDTMELDINPKSSREFIYPYANFKLISRGTQWGGFSIKKDDYIIFEKLSKPEQTGLLKKYYTESLPISTAQDLYINDTSLVYDGAYADVFSDQSDTLTRRNYSEINTLVYSDATRGITEEAFLYKHLKTDIPISIGNSNIVWPIDTFDFFQNIPITVLNDTCLPVKLADMDASNNMLGCVAGSSYSNSDVIFKLNSRSEEIIEAAWLGSGNINNINIDMGLNVYDDEIASYCSSHLEGNVQGGIATIIQPLEKISFVWMDKDTYADDVIFYRKHAEDCPYLKTSPHNYYQNQDFNNPNPLVEGQKYWSNCRCKSVNYSPIGHSGNKFTDYNGLADYLFADPQGLGDDFTINSWLDTRGYNAYNSPQFSFYKLDGKEGDQEVGWGTGYWKTGNDKRMILKTGRRYTYYRTSIRNDISNTLTTTETPYIVIKYAYKNVQGCEFSSGKYDLCIILDVSTSEHKNINTTKEIVKEFIKNALACTGDVQVSIVTFSETAANLSFLSRDFDIINQAIHQIPIPTTNPIKKTDITSAFKAADYILNTEIKNVEAISQNDILDLCRSLDDVLSKIGKKTIRTNSPRADAKKTILLFSDGDDNLKVNESIPYASALKQKGIRIHAIDVGPNSYYNDKMEIIASPSCYFNLQKYLYESDGSINNFIQYLLTTQGSFPIIPTWYRLLKNTNGEWISTRELSDMVLEPGDYIKYDHKSEASFTGPNGTSFGTPSISFTINIKLNGWDYFKNEFNPNAIGDYAGSKPYWGKSYSNVESYYDQHFDKQTKTFGGQVRFINDYVLVHQPEVSSMILKNSDFMTYERRGRTALEWNLSLTFSTYLSSYKWKKMIFKKDFSNLQDLLNLKNKLDLIAYSSNEESQMILEGYNSFIDAKYNYFARNPFNYTQGLFYDKKCLSFVIFTSGLVLKASEPYANLDNIFYPTVATIPNLSLSVTDKQVGEYLLPENLGVSHWRGRGYKIEVNKESLNLSDSLSAERMFLDTNKYGPRNRGLTKKDQITPVKITEIDNRWMFESYSSSTIAGRIKDTLNNQKFTPYQSKYEITKRNPFGLSNQDDDFKFWSSKSNWNTKNKYPVGFRKELLASSYIKRIEDLLIDKGSVVSWKIDIFGNNYGLFKSYEQNDNFFPFLGFKQTPSITLTLSTPQSNPYIFDCGCNNGLKIISKYPSFIVNNIPSPVGSGLMVGDDKLKYAIYPNPRKFSL